MASDEQLMAAIADGSDTAFSELLRRYERPLAGFLRRQVGDADAQDVFQEVWLCVARSAVAFDHTRRFKPWMYRIALNEVRSWWARVRPGRDASIDVADMADAPSKSPSDAIDVERLLATLPTEQREVMVLRYQLDLSEAEIAELLSVPRGTVKSRAHAALSSLSQHVRAERQH